MQVHIVLAQVSFFKCMEFESPLQQDQLQVLILHSMYMSDSLKVS